MIKWFARSETGNVAVLTALCMPVLIGGAGFGVEIGYDYYEQVHLQQAADAGAFAGAVEQRRGSANTLVVSTGSGAATANGAASADTVTITPNGAGNNTVTARITRNEPRLFSGLFVSQPLLITVNATAALSTAANACVLALDPTASAAINFSGNTTSTFNNCVVMADSISSSAVNTQGSAQVYVPCMYAVGGVSTTSGDHLTSCSAPQTGQGPVGDPFAGLQIPSATGNCQNGNGANLQPGRYCGGVSFKNNVNLQPGVYIIDGGTLQANANANVSGTGVTFVFLNNASISLNGNATFNVSAPTSGTYAGFLMVGSRTNTNVGNTINGTATSSMTGNIYFPNQAVSYLGNFSGSGGCTHIVAKTVQWTGNTTVQVDCSSYGLQSIPVGGVTLIG
ncbi:pilus assembly protein TadG-related protein [Caulobacter sp. KR2-114]|uniref:TadE/TadG family type IV pilus assembly protein n=1 Tax=Caulobacter sp. KR2-114 TaxID=3400912 RepID=UPI003C0269B1